jgi:hypothetical protein
MARLTDTSGRFIDLVPLGFVFTLEELWQGADEYDHNWMHAQLTVHDHGEPSTKHGAGLPQFELRELVVWLRRLDLGALQLPSQWRNVEDGITFEAKRVDGLTRLRCRVNLDFAHPSRFGFQYGNPDDVVDFYPSSDDLRRFAEELEQELAPFPFREPPSRAP